jgi:hypothetical protein
MTTIKLSTEYVTVDCPTCGFEFALSESFVERRRKDGRDFYCPASNGPTHHSMSYGESEADKLRKQLDAVQRRLDSAQGTITHLRDQWESAERSARAQRAANTRLRKRVSNGVCPCCRRTFADLARHMSGQHPDYATTVDA